MTDSHKDDTPDQCRITCAVVEGVRVVTAQGEIDHDTTPAFGESLLSANDTLAHRRIVADLSGVTFMDASGVNVLIAAYRQVTGTEGWLRIAGAQPSVLRVLQTVGVDAFIPCLPTTEQALNSRPPSPLGRESPSPPEASEGVGARSPRSPGRSYYPAKHPHDGRMFRP